MVALRLVRAGSLVGLALVTASCNAPLRAHPETNAASKGPRGAPASSTPSTPSDARGSPSAVSASSSAPPAPSPPDDSARVAPSAFPACPSGTSRISRAAFDGRKGLACARVHGKVVTLHGPSWSWFDDRHLARTDDYVDGKRHGPSVCWFRNGLRHQTGGFSQGVPDGDWRAFHPNGVLAEESHYEQGRLDGPRRRFFANGTKSLEASYEHGAPTGTWTAFYDAAPARPALRLEFSRGREATPSAGFLPDGAAWPAESASGVCGNACDAALAQLDLDAFPPIAAAPCSASTESTGANQGAANPAGPVMKAARGAWSSEGGLDNVNSFVPRGCIDSVKLSCAPELDGVPGAELLGEIAYRVYQTDCASAQRSGVSVSRASVVLSPPGPGSPAWHAHGLIGYDQLDAPGVESGSYVHVEGFVRLPSGRAAVRVHETTDAGDCGGETRDEILVLKNDAWSAVNARTIRECNQAPEMDLSDPF